MSSSDSVPIAEKMERLRSLLRTLDSCLVAYSGGVDSTFLAMVAFQELGEGSLAVIADSPSLPRSELAEARETARDTGFPLEVVRTREFEREAYLENTPDRCYFCKAELFRVLEDFARRRGIATILYGENASDLGDRRPGRTAAGEHGVLSPLCEAGLAKEEIRSLSRSLGLPTAGKPALPCLSSRIPHGERVTREKLQMVERGELALRRMGFREFRVRIHESGRGYLARLEIAGSEWSRLGDTGLRQRIGRTLREAGFRQATLDLQTLHSSP